ncbi:hypothetical protein [Promicromonospora sp. NPDC019610]|uniref:hypothetical protein n=1 Tax=Promicromonospora sp. NPDC019610 TaxID=3364405 RepID=UPI0037A83DE7
MGENVSGTPAASGPASGSASTTPDGGKGLWTPDWRDIGKRLLGVAGVILAVWLIYQFLDAFLPRWWAQVIGNAVDGSFAAGAWWGLLVGAVFTLVPVLFLAQAVFTRRSWQVRGALLALAVVFAVPNLMTLGIVLGTSAAAHAGERILDVNGPAFRGGSAWGAVAGGVVALVIVTMTVLYRRRGAHLKELRAKQG